MKKLLAITLTCIFFSGVQAKENSGVRITGGFGISTMYFSNVANNYNDIKSKVKPGGFFGVGYERRLVKFFAIQPEINYLNRGAKREFTNVLTNQKVRLVLGVHTIEIPILAKFYIGKHFNLYAGPAITFNLAASTRSRFYDLNGTEVNSYKGVNVMKSKYKDSDGNRPYKVMDFGFDFGLEAVIVKGFFIGGRINQGVLDQTNDKYKGYNGSDAVILPGDKKWVGSTSANLYAGYRF